MPETYDNQGVRFAYPDNWTVEDPPGEEAELQVTVSSPDTAFWSLNVYPGLRDIRELRQEVLQAMQAEYPQTEADEVEEIVDGTPVVGYDLGFYCFDLTNSAKVRVFHRQRSTCLVLCQSEDREYEQVEPVFDAMTACLLKRDLIFSSD